ncbi:hypothetical protein F66182_6839 [Fusarium sp. NRRL 66182]|nr:hypothetical protein F66182_6839 [Fusarium sp. NRRL 66182]
MRGRQDLRETTPIIQGHQAMPPVAQLSQQGQSKMASGSSMLRQTTTPAKSDRDVRGQDDNTSPIESADNTLPDPPPLEVETDILRDQDMEHANDGTWRHG